jgi:hypothetical protein
MSAGTCRSQDDLDRQLPVPDDPPQHHLHRGPGAIRSYQPDPGDLHLCPHRCLFQFPGDKVLLAAINKVCNISPDELVRAAGTKHSQADRVRKQDLPVAVHDPGVGRRFRQEPVPLLAQPELLHVLPEPPDEQRCSKEHQREEDAIQYSKEGRRITGREEETRAHQKNKYARRRKRGILPPDIQGQEEGDEVEDPDRQAQRGDDVDIEYNDGKNEDPGHGPEGLFPTAEGPDGNGHTGEFSDSR